MLYSLDTNSCPLQNKNEVNHALINKNTTLISACSADLTRNNYSILYDMPAQPLQWTLHDSDKSGITGPAVAGAHYQAGVCPSAVRAVVMERSTNHGLVGRESLISSQRDSWGYTE